MKKDLSKSLIFILAVFIYLLIIPSGCKKSDINELNTVKEQTKVSDDKVFQERTLEIISFLTKIKDKQEIISLSNKQNLSEKEIELIYKNLGFKDLKEYTNYITKLNNDLIYLNNKYNLKSYSKEKLEKEVIATFKNNERNSSKLRDIGNCAETCRIDLAICIGEATTGAIMAHYACAALDPTIIWGAGCHAAVLAWQATKMYICDTQYQSCLRNCSGN